jgi:hypothetical protein
VTRRRGQGRPREEILADLDVAEHLRGQLVRLGLVYLDPEYEAPPGDLTADGFRAELAKFDREIAGLRAALRSP